VNTAQALLAVVLLQQGLLCALWLVAGRLSLARRAASHWAVAAALVALSMAVLLGRGTLPLWLSVGMGNWLLVAAMVAQRRGVQRFARRAPGDREHAAVLGLAAAGMFAASMLQDPMLPAIVAGGLAIGWTLLRSSHEIATGLRAEFAGSARGCAAPLALAGTMFALRGALAPLFPDTLATSIVADTGANAAMVFAGLALGLVLNMALMAMVVVRLVSRLQHQSDHDALTGLLGRRPLQRELHAAAERQQRTGERFAMLSVDIDHFKRINDSHGHAAGDAVLVRVARALREASRAPDRVARIGGEEFCLLLPAVQPGDARRVAERVLQTARALVHPELGDGAVVTVSVGLAVAERGEAPDRLFRRLDRALYRAKTAGRDRIEVATEAEAATRPATEMA
jgi:diguanylate cyclase (GGDEF)-like protein